MSLFELLRDAFLNHACAVALEEPNQLHTYGELWKKASNLAGLMNVADPDHQPVAIIADHSALGYAAVLAALLSGRPYVPLKPDLPSERIRYIITAAGCRIVVGDPDLIEKNSEAFRTLVSISDGTDGQTLVNFERPTGDPIAYIMFTSGSTGQPKGVVLRQSNIFAYYQAARALFPLLPSDRCSQLFDLSFDLSVHDILMTFAQGATLVVDPRKQAIDPVGFAASQNLTVWFSVPSVLSMAKRFRRLKSGCLPALRLSLFCGEALPMDLAEEWLAVAPNSACFNVYGPTEATIAITHFRFDGGVIRDFAGSTVPIGVPYPGSLCKIDAPDQEFGELLLGGPQVSSGYLNNRRQTLSSFFRIEDVLWYKSGDLVKWCDPFGFIYLGRMDGQVKIGGYRIELAEVEIAIRSLGLVDEVAVVDVATGGEKYLAALLIGASDAAEQIVSGLSKKLPKYMIPRQYVNWGELPLNSNGKVDRIKIRGIFS